MDLVRYDVLRGFEEIAAVYDIVFRNGGYVAGSYAAYMGAPAGTHIISPNDVDIFATSEEAFNKIGNTLCEAGMRWQRASSIAETMTPNLLLKPICKMTLQIIKPHPGWETWPNDIVDSFDLTVSKAVLVDPDTILADPELGSESARILRINDPLKSLERVIKYAQRGVKFDAWELHKLFLAYAEMSEERKAELAAHVAELREPSTFANNRGDDWYYDDDDYFEGE